MATKKQKRRREKERRHEYEYVYVDEEGQEVEVDEPGQERKNGKSPAQRAVKTDRGRTVDPPSWRRTLRRAAIFSPLMFVILYLLRPSGATLGSVLFSVALLMVFFIPFSFFMDTLMFRLAQRRAEKARGSSSK
jgi:Flp pilus assembly protein TadB